jgi:hypothetical protein
MLQLPGEVMIIHDDDAAKLSEVIGQLERAHAHLFNTFTALALTPLHTSIDELRNIRDRLELEPDIDDDLDEALLVDIIPLDGGDPDEEHIKLMESFEFDDTSEESEDASLTELNKLLAKCTRAARAEFVEDDEETEDDMRDEQ